jgi:hypothetical protein
MLCLAANRKGGINMTEEEIKPFERAYEPPHPATGFQPLDSRVVNLWRVSALIGFGVLLLILFIPVVVAAMAKPRALVWVAGVWLAAAAAAVWFSFWYRREGVGDAQRKGVSADAAVAALALAAR